MYYAITGVVDGDHFHRIIEAESLRDAESLFTESVFEEIAENYEYESIEDVYDDYAPPWIVSAIRTSHKPEFIYGA